MVDAVLSICAIIETGISYKFEYLVRAYHRRKPLCCHNILILYHNKLLFKKVNTYNSPDSFINMNLFYITSVKKNLVHFFFNGECILILFYLLSSSYVFLNE